MTSIQQTIPVTVSISASDLKRQFFRAVRTGSVSRLKSCLEAGVEIDQDNDNAAITLIARGDLKMLQLFLDYGFNPRTFPRANDALRAAVTHNRFEMVKLWLQWGALASKNHEPLLIDAICRGHFKIANLLVAYGVDPSMIKIGLDHGAIQSSPSVLDWLRDSMSVKSVPKPPPVDLFGLTLPPVTFKDPPEKRPVLTEQRITFHLTPKEISRQFEKAARHGKLHIVHSFLQANAVSEADLTNALISAAHKNHACIVPSLLSHYLKVPLRTMDLAEESLLLAVLEQNITKVNTWLQQVPDPFFISTYVLPTAIFFGMDEIAKNVLPFVYDFSYGILTFQSVQDKRIQGNLLLEMMGRQEKKVLTDHLFGTVPATKTQLRL